MNPSVDKVTSLFEHIQASFGSSALAYWALPNVVLTLSGARAYCDGVFWSDDSKLLELWDKEIKQAIPVVNDHIELVASESNIATVRENESYASFEIMTTEGLDYVLQNTKMLDISRQELTRAGVSPSGIMKKLIAELRIRKQFELLNEDEVNDVAFGILVGYPDKAITESLPLWRNDDPFAEPLMDADIRGAGYYVCPKPVYSYPRRLADNRDIKTNEMLWSQILRDYYNSAFHKKLELEPEFISKMNELKNFR